MGITEFKRYFDTLNICPVFPNEFTAHAPKNSAVVVASGTTDRRGEVDTIALTLIVRADKPDTAESRALTFTEQLDGKTDFIVGDTQVILAKAVHRLPMYIGTDSEGLFYYELEFSLLLN